ncbi:MAG: response regulator, partial [Halobacteriales archaeon]|nr:response regulator [Halobacteriales archaeon]
MDTRNETRELDTADNRTEVEVSAGQVHAVALGTTVETIMEPRGALVNPDMSARRALEVLRNYDLNLGIVGDEGHLPVGVVYRSALTNTDSDTELELHERASGSRHRSGPAPSRSDEGQDLARTGGAKVSELMLSALPVPANASVALAAGILASSGVECLVVIAPDGRTSGVVSERTVMAWLGQVTGDVGSLSDTQQVVADALRTLDESARELRTNGSPARRRVLVVDDDVAICDGIVSVLEEEGFNATRALDGRQALEMLQGMPAPPGLILLDLMMPMMNGWEFREAQLNDPRLHDIPVVVLTAHGGLLSRSELGDP